MAQENDIVTANQGQQGNEIPNARQAILADEVEELGYSDIATALRGPYVLGSNVIIRTVTNYWTGRIVGVHPDALVLRDAAWVADTGRFHAAVQEGEPALVEVEPVFVRVVVGRGSIVDCCDWVHPLPRTVK